jgi:glycosyltransferase involved in cell wall biosynthesis
MEISVCIITKNEMNKLEKCLRALQPLRFEIVVVDTGSVDDTKQMAMQYTDSIYDFAWCDDFSAAKNYAISKAKHDMVLVLDSDEYMEISSVEDKKLLEELIRSHPGEVGRIRIANRGMRGNETCVNREWVSRLFDRRLFHYEGRIHEQVVSGSVFDYLDGSYAQPTKGMRALAHDSRQTFLTNIEVDHDGYGGNEEDRRKKAERNIQLLQQEFEADSQDTYLMYQLGKSYYMAGDYPEAVRYFELALGYDLDPKLEYVIDMVETYGYALLNVGQPETALLLKSVYEEFGDSADFQFLMGLIYMNNEQFDDAIDEFLKATKHKDARSEGANSYLAYYNAGVIKECLGDTKQAIIYYQKCGTYEKAMQRQKILKNK